MQTFLFSVTFVAGLFVGTAYARARLMPVIRAYEDVHAAGVKQRQEERKDCESLARIAARLKNREAEARKILEHMAPCDPAVREWLGKK